jgi:hypothetical protein
MRFNYSKFIGASTDFCNFNSQFRYPGKALTNNRHSTKSRATTEK